MDFPPRHGPSDRPGNTEKEDRVYVGVWDQL